MKKLVLKSFKDGDKRYFWIDEQMKIDQFGIIFTASNGITIRSVQYPAFYDNCLYIRGASVSADFALVPVSDEQWAAIKVVVAEFNNSNLRKPSTLIDVAE